LKSTFIGLSLKNIKEIDLSTFNGLTSLQVLDLSSNKITFIKPDTFFDCFSLLKLMLHENQIKSINLASFNGLYALEELSLENNEITRISERIFGDLVNLKTLNLKSNEIVAIEKDTLFGLHWLEKICIYDNPIVTYFPDLLNNICPSVANPKCKIDISTYCF